MAIGRSRRAAVVPLDRPLHLGDVVVAHRDYVIVEVTTTDGLVGRAIGNARNSPVHLFVHDVIAPMVVGLDPLRTENAWSRMYYGCLPIGQRGAQMRALSLLDICCWDIKAERRAAAGDAARRLPRVVDVAIAGGYPDLTPDPADVEEEVAGHFAGGYRAIKVAAHGSPADTARLQAARLALWRRHAVDGRPALVVARPPSGDQRRNAMEPSRPRLDRGSVPRSICQSPYPVSPRRAHSLALGEDRAGLDDFVQILDRDHPDYLRADATVCGGITEFLRIAAVAGAHGRAVSPHVFPEVDVHLAAAVPNVMGVETLERARTDPHLPASSTRRGSSGPNCVTNGSRGSA